MKILKKIVSLLLTVSMICSVVVISSFEISGLSVRQGYITGGNANVYAGPSDKSDFLGTLAENTQVVVTKTGFRDNDKTIWYKLTATTDAGNIEGFVHYSYVKIIGSAKSFSAVITKDKGTYVFSHAGDWNEKLCSAPKDMELTVVGEENDYDGDKWYQVVVQSGEKVVEGYVYSSCLKIVSYTADENFEAYLDQEGFPESYKVRLRQIHTVYPNWKFVADHIKPNWDEVVAGETDTAVNTVAASSPESWKSMNDGAYNWETGKYVVWDSGGWVQAADNVVKYYLDPRNFLTTGSEIFQFIQMNYDKEQNTKERLQLALNGTFMEGEFPEDSYETYADVLIKAAEESGVSPISLAAMIIVEQGSKGTGNCISGTQEGYKGYYNFYNIGAYAHSGKSAVENGLKYAKDNGWNSRAAAIIGGAKFYAGEYINRGQNNLYYKKFNVVAEKYFSHQYMSNIQAAVHESQQTARGYAEILSSELVFNIPVYQNIPEEVMPYPVTDGNNNCYLADISLNGYEYTPTFNPYVSNYEIIVEGNVSKIVVTPVKADEKANVTGGGTIDLAVGANTIKISVKSTSGIEKTYTVSVVRKASQGSTNGDPEISSTVYKVGEKTISAIMPQTSTEVFVTNLNVTNGSAEVSSTDGIIKNGDVVEILDNDGNVRYTYTLIVAFDVNSDGKCSLLDLSLIKKHLLRKSELTGNSFSAADVNYDGKVTLSDLSLIKRKLLKIEI